ncbi:MAG: hypothetical protein M1838_005708 [Thelocarpon superellum]|nr:MAG: hypothetical protein M1838_005708 [Thelocarpon superellum]
MTGDDPIPNGEASTGIPSDYANLDELVGPTPIAEDDRRHDFQRQPSLETVRREEQKGREEETRSRRFDATFPRTSSYLPHKVQNFSTELYTISYLVVFAILGTLARLGLEALTFYPGTPAWYGTLWANFGGCVVMGFLSEDRRLFEAPDETRHPKAADADAAAKKAHTAMKKTIPLFIGLATGFCGSFTSFSRFLNDAFLALSNDLPTPTNAESSRAAGYSVMAVLAVIITTISVSISGLKMGAHLALSLDKHTPRLPSLALVNPLAIFLAISMWLGAIFLAIFSPSNAWRGQVLFSLVFAPLGCLLRFYLSRALNSRLAAFPLGTFTANMSGTLILGMAWDLQRVPLSPFHIPGGSITTCQVLEGVQGGFSGCLTTVSTWVLELNGLRPRHAYVYGGVSVSLALASLVVVMGSLRWTRGFEQPICVIPP